MFSFFMFEIFAAVTLLVFITTCVAFARRNARESLMPFPAPYRHDDKVSVEDVAYEFIVDVKADTDEVGYEFITKDTIHVIEPEAYGVMYRKIIRDNGYMHDEASMWKDLGFCEYVAETALEDRNWNAIHSEDWKFYHGIYTHVAFRAFGVTQFA